MDASSPGALVQHCALLTATESGYTAAKGAVVNLSGELGLEYAKAGIQVNALCPGFYRTEFGEYGDPQFVATVSGFTPMGRVAAASEIRGPALFLASAASDFMTGQCLIVDGDCMAKWAGIDVSCAHHRPPRRASHRRARARARLEQGYAEALHGSCASR